MHYPSKSFLQTYLSCDFNQVEETKGKCENLSMDQESAIDVFAEERERRDIEEGALRKKLEVCFVLFLFLLL